MNEHDDILTRFRSANPVNEHEFEGRVDEAAARAALRAIVREPADPVRPRAWRPRHVRVAVVGMALAVAITAAVLTVPQGGPTSRGVLGKAYAALATGDGIIHVRATITYKAPGYPGASAERFESWETERFESWETADGRMWHGRWFEPYGDGREAAADGSRVQMLGFPPIREVPEKEREEVVKDGPLGKVLSYPQDRITVGWPTLGSLHVSEFAAALRSSTDDREVKYVGEDEIDGRPVYELRIVGPPPSSSPPPPESRGVSFMPEALTIWIDRETHLPVQERASHHRTEGGGVSTIRYDVFERLPDNPENRRLLKIGSRP